MPVWFWPYNLSSRTIFQENNSQGEQWEQSPAESFLLLKTEHGCQARRSVGLCVHLTACAFRQFLSLHCHPQPRAFVRNVAQPSWTVWCLLNSCWVWAEFLGEGTAPALWCVHEEAPSSPTAVCDLSCCHLEKAGDARFLHRKSLLSFPIGDGSGWGHWITTQMLWP